MPRDPDFTCQTMQHAQYMPGSCCNGCFLRCCPALRNGCPFLGRLLDCLRWDPCLGRIRQLLQQLGLLLRQLWSICWDWLRLRRRCQSQRVEESPLQESSAGDPCRMVQVQLLHHLQQPNLVLHLPELLQRTRDSMLSRWCQGPPD